MTSKVLAMTKRVILTRGVDTNPAVLYKKDVVNVYYVLYRCGQIDRVPKITRMYRKNQWRYYHVKYADGDSADCTLGEILKIVIN